MSSDAHGIPERPRGDEAPRDGIGEEDNAIPLWFNLGFYRLIGVGVVYIAYYAFLSDWSIWLMKPQRMKNVRFAAMPSCGIHFKRAKSFNQEELL